MPKLKVDFSNAIKTLKKSKAKKVILQIPEGLKPRAIELAAEIEEKAGVKVFVFTDPCFGACDLPLKEKELLKADFIVHVGHNEFMAAQKTIYVPATYEIPKKIIKKTTKKIVSKLRKLKIKKVILLTTINFYPYLKIIKETLEKKGFQTITSKGLRTKPGQMLGCDSSSGTKKKEKVQGLVFLGDGVFHPIAVALTVSKPLIMANLLQGKISVFSEKQKDSYVRQRITAIARAKESKVFGILVTTKIGQMRTAKAEKLKKIIELHNRKAFLLAGDMLTEENMLGIKVDCFVCTGCPRIAVDDGRHWKKPVVNPQELLVALGEKKMNELLFVDSF